MVVQRWQRSQTLLRSPCSRLTVQLRYVSSCFVSAVSLSSLAGARFFVIQAPSFFVLLPRVLRIVLRAMASTRNSKRRKLALAAREATALQVEAQANAADHLARRANAAELQEPPADTQLTKLRAKAKRLSAAGVLNATKYARRLDVIWRLSGV